MTDGEEDQSDGRKSEWSTKGGREDCKTEWNMTDRYESHYISKSNKFWLIKTKNATWTRERDEYVINQSIPSPSLDTSKNVEWRKGSQTMEEEEY